MEGWQEAGIWKNQDHVRVSCGGEQQRPRTIPVPVQRELQQMSEKLKEQENHINTLLAERHERQIERQLESCRLMKRNLEELRRSRNANSSGASHNGPSHKTSSLKRKLPWLKNQGKCKKVAQTKQQYHPEGAGPQSCPRCERYHQGTDCDGKKICYGCQKPGHISWNCPLEAAKKRSQNLSRKSVLTRQQKQKPHPCWKREKLICFKCLQPGHISVYCPLKVVRKGLRISSQATTSHEMEAGTSSEMVPDTNA